MHESIDPHRRPPACPPALCEDLEALPVAPSQRAACDAFARGVWRHLAVGDQPPAGDPVADTAWDSLLAAVRMQRALFGWTAENTAMVALSLNNVPVPPSDGPAYHRPNSPSWNCQVHHEKPKLGIDQGFYLTRALNSEAALAPVSMPALARLMVPPETGGQKIFSLHIPSGPFLSTIAQEMFDALDPATRSVLQSLRLDNTLPRPSAGAPRPRL